MRWLKWFRLAGVLLFLWILSKIDWKTVLQTIKTLKPGYLAAYVLCFACMIFVRVIRLRLCARKLGVPLSLPDSYVTTVEPALMGAVTPGRVGELTRIGHLQRHGMALPSALALVGMERLVDLAILAAFGLGGMVYIFSPAPIKRFAFIVTGVFLFVLYLFFAGFDHVAPVLQRASAAGLRRLSLLSAASSEKVFGAFHRTIGATASTMQFLGLAYIGFNFIQIYMLGRAFGFRADSIVICFAYTVSTLLSVLPISPAGLGTREATYIYIMAREGIGKEQALLFSLLDGVVLGPTGLFILLAPLWIIRAGARIRASISGRRTNPSEQGLWLLLSSIRERGPIKTLSFVIQDAYFDLMFRTNTRTPVSVDNLVVVGGNKRHAASYEPAKWALLKRVFGLLIDSGRIDPQATCLVDFGCGKGRVLIVALHYGISEVVGVEFDEELCGICKENVQRYIARQSGRKGAFWQVVHEDAATFQLPRDANLFFLHDPFTGPVLESVAAGIREACRASGGRPLVVYVNPVCGDVFDRMGFVRDAESDNEVAMYTWG